MANTLTLQQLESYQTMLSGGHIGDFYQTMSDHGYRYAGWAAGVARGDSITGASALEYLRGSALMGLGSDACKNLSEQRINDIRRDMAQGYLDTLKQKAKDSGGNLNRDVTYKETYKFHEKAFDKNGLGIDNWTLRTPFDIITDKYGEDVAEERWERIRDTGGQGWDGLMESMRLMKEMGDAAFKAPDAETREKAQDWIDKAPGTANWDAIGRFLDVLWEKMRNTSLPAMGDPFTGMPWPGIDSLTDRFFDTARAWRQPIDPLMLDLDGDGLELSRATGSILFDHDADGIRTGTGWIGSDDGILVRDVDGSGTIETGRELFGVDTVKLNGQKAVNGFDALADLDSTLDGNLSSADLAWSSVKLWRDLDQDGVSDTGELFALDALGISRIGVVGSATNATGGTQAGTIVNGNAIAQSASFTQTISGIETTRSIGAVDLESNAFYREFTTPVPLTEAAKALPAMQGSGRARDLQEAASLSPALAATVALFAAAPTRDAQLALLDALLTDWAQSSDYWSTLEESLQGNVAISGLPAGMTAAQYRRLIGVLEVFNGERFYAAPAAGSTPVAGFATGPAPPAPRAASPSSPPATASRLRPRSWPCCSKATRP